MKKNKGPPSLFDGGQFFPRPRPPPHTHYRTTEPLPPTRALAGGDEGRVGDEVGGHPRVQLLLERVQCLAQLAALLVGCSSGEAAASNSTREGQGGVGAKRGKKGSMGPTEQHHTFRRHFCALLFAGESRAPHAVALQPRPHLR